jgi:hypothetical protein
MDTEPMLRGAEMLMLLGVDRHCPDCATTTIFLPVLDDGAAPDEMVCTSCDGAVLVGPARADAVLAA